MRTTVTLEPDVELLLKRTVREQGLPFKQVLNAALREGLHAVRAPQPKPFKQRTFDMGTPLVDLTKAGALADELGDQAIIEKMAAGR